MTKLPLLRVSVPFPATLASVAEPLNDRVGSTWKRQVLHVLGRSGSQVPTSTGATDVSSETPPATEISAGVSVAMLSVTEVGSTM